MKNQKILIVGAGDAGKELLREITTHKELGITPLGFVDDDKRKIGRKIGGLPVIGNINGLGDYIKNWQIDKVFIALPSVDGSIISDVLARCVGAGVPCQTIPRVREIIEGKVDIKRIRDVQIEDLLDRPIIKHDVKDVLSIIKNQVILVTGAAGSIGSELCRQIASYKPARIIMYDWWENGLYEMGVEFEEFFPNIPIVLVVGNIQDRNRIEFTLAKHKPSIIFHAAAYKHVPLMEENVIEAVKNNILGTKILVEAARNRGVENFVFISTDKAVNPKSIMGMTKLAGELIVSSMNSISGTRFISVRFGNVLDSAGSVLPLFKKQITNGDGITITDKNMTRYFMTIPEAVQLILKAAVLGKGEEIFILDMGEPIKIIDLAKKFILLSGLLPDKDIKINYIGRRPGEKLTEELVTKDETMTKTRFEKIFVIKRNEAHVEGLNNLITNLEKYSNVYNEKAVKEELKSFVTNLNVRTSRKSV